MSEYFITGTDTGVGKTWVTLALMKSLQDKGKAVVGMKPVASGCQKTSAGLCNDDALRILKQSSQDLDYKTVNPYAFEQAIAPHIAAEMTGAVIDIKRIVNEFIALKKDSDSVVVEGVGGWNVPLGADIMLADMVARLDLKVILVVGLRLGCINHALSAARSIEADAGKLHGWVTSRLDPNYACPKESMATLRARIKAPLLGNLPYMESLDVEMAASKLSI